MIGVRLPSRVVRPDIMRGLFVVAAVLAVGVGHRGHGIQGAADSKSDSKFVDPFLAEDVETPSESEIPGIPDLEDKPDRKAASEKEMELELEIEPDESPKQKADPKAAGQAPLNPSRSVRAIPAGELELPADSESQDMPKLDVPRLTREIKKTAPPKLDSDQDVVPESELGPRDGAKSKSKLPSLKNLPNAEKSGWKSTALEPPGSPNLGKPAADGPPAESARFESSGAIEDLNEPIVKIVIEGNKTIKTEEIRKLIKTREGRLADPKVIKEDVRTLVAKRWFANVETRVALSKDGPGRVLVFKVVELPMLQKVTYIGNKKIKDKALNDVTQLKVNGGYDVGANREAVHHIQSLYQEKGYLHTTVELEKGDSLEDREVVFKIDEGPKVVVNKITFAGNRYFPSSVLKTQIKTKKVILWWFGGKFDKSTTEDDIVALKKYYQELGFFDVQVRSKIGASEDKSKIHVEYVIEEGERFKIRKIEFVGNRVIPEDKLRKDLKAKPNDLYALRFVNLDKDKIVAQYGELGRINAKVEPRTRSFETAGYVDLVYEINEDQPYRIGRIHVHINGDHPHTKESAVLTKLTFKPGELASQAKIDKSKQRLKGCQLFAGGNPGQAQSQPGASPPEIVLRASELPAQPRSFNVARGQDDSTDIRPTRVRKPAAPVVEESSIFRGQNAGGNTPPDDLPFRDSQDGPPPETDYEEQPKYIDAVVNVFEAQTGRIQMGIGVNSNAGLAGNVTLEENNFDILRPPTSMQDIVDGTSWRGGGQQFRIEAMPGIQFSRYLVSWRDPYFLDQNVIFGVSGSYYNRYFYNWTEIREGGRVTLGHQFSPYLSGTVVGRAEQVNISNPSVPTPQEYLAVLGNSFLSTVQGNIIHDTRDHPMLPGSGHYIQGSVEEGIADFVYQKYDLEGKQYFLVKERPDGGNRHVISVLGNIGWIGSNSPFYERFFAGGFGFNTFRGFQFQGVTPTADGVRLGGQFMALGTLEYQIPITADNMIQIVTFTDFGTVDSTATLANYRQTVGAGLRLTIPMMGPVPIAIDFAVPIRRQSFDTTQVISFSMGAAR